MRKWKTQNYHRVLNFNDLGEIKRTGLSAEVLTELGNTLTTIPEDFHIHPQIKKIYEARKKTIDKKEGIDFGTA